MDSSAVFNKAVSIAESLPKGGAIQTTYEEKLTLYALYKQATLGDAQGSRPGILDQLGRAKWDAWKKRSGTKDAGKLYADTLIKVGYLLFVCVRSGTRLMML